MARLEQRYGEALVAIGQTNTGAWVEVLATGDGATWTIVLTDPAGMSCLVAAGEGWRAVAPVEGEGT